MEIYSFFHHDWHTSCFTEFWNSGEAWRCLVPKSKYNIILTLRPAKLADLAGSAWRICACIKNPGFAAGAYTEGERILLRGKSLPLEGHVLDKERGDAATIACLVPHSSNDVVYATLGILPVSNANPFGGLRIC